MKVLYDPMRYHQFSIQNSTSDDVELLKTVQSELRGWKVTFWIDAWRLENITVVDRLYKRADIKIELDEETRRLYDKYLERLEREDKSEKKIDEIKSRKTSDLVIEGIKGTPKEYQKLAVEFLDASGGNGFLSLPMGSGKTLCALLYVMYKKFNKTLVISPASAKYVWDSQVHQWTDLFVYVLESSDLKKGKENELLKKLDAYDVIVINYDILKKYYLLLKKIKFDCAILDEAHYIKSISQRTKFAKGIIANIKNRILLSGTPMLNRPVELFNSLNILDPINWNNYKDFCVRYCNGRYGYWGWEANGATHIDELKNKIKRYFLRWEKEEILKELPPKVYTSIPVDLPSDIRKKYNLALNNFKLYLSGVLLKNDKEVERSMRAERMVAIGELRKIATEGKVGFAEEFVNNIIDCGEKVLVFSSYNAPLEYLQKKLGDKCVLITGKTDSGLERKVLEEKFQKDPSIKVFLGGIKSAGVALTLTAAKNVLFLDYSWVPADHDQAADRIHRIGQEAESLSIYQVIAKNTIDETIKEMLDEKRKTFEAVFGTESQEWRNGSIINDLMERLDKSS